jgi:HEPN domain-containing protein
MTVPSELLEAVRTWIKKAEEDLYSTELLLAPGESSPFSNVCLHAQQCAEKYIKALLVFHSVPVPRIHDLQELLLRVPRKVGLEITINDVGVLTRYAIEGRYPGDWDPIGRDEAEEAVAAAKKVRKAIRAHLPKETLD